jgi:hypothetical protein
MSRRSPMMRRADAGALLCLGTGDDDPARNDPAFAQYRGGRADIRPRRCLLYGSKALSGFRAHRRHRAARPDATSFGACAKGLFARWICTGSSHQFGRTHHEKMIKKPPSAARFTELEDFLRAPNERRSGEVTLGTVAICPPIFLLPGHGAVALPSTAMRAAGVVTSVGTGVNGITVGDSVVVTLIRSAAPAASRARGACRPCGT